MKDKRKSNEEEILKQIKKADSKLENGVFYFSTPLTVSAFANSIGKSANAIVQYFFEQGKMYNLNYLLNEEQIAELCIKFNYDFKKERKITAVNFMHKIKLKDKKSDLVERPPVVTIMGHVDHGKTTLIDKIRKTNYAATEAGRITQHTGAYQVVFNRKKITIIDTPGHEAFTEMRARGANITDIVVLVVAADDGVMPQTVEAIEHVQNAKVPIIVFVNKTDKPNCDLDKIRAELSRHNIVSEKWGGDTQFVYGSALTGKGIEELLKAILIQAEILELNANPNRHAIGSVIEAKIDKGRGVVLTLLVTNGSLMKRDFIVVGPFYGRVRTLETFESKQTDKIKPGTPAIITGFNFCPKPGNKFFGFENEKTARALSKIRNAAEKESELKINSSIVEEDGMKILNVLIRTDVFGTSEALKQTIGKIKNAEVKVQVIRSAAGPVSKSDILLAETANAYVLAFNLKVDNVIKDFANSHGIKIISSNVVYDMTKEIKKVIKGMLSPKYERVLCGKAKILKVIPISSVGNIAGCIVTSGKVVAKARVKIYREGKLIFEGKLKSLRREKDDVKQVDKGYECGCLIKKFNDIKVDDVIEFYEKVEIEQ